eukprot:TRINITY_DN1539_c0_g1_i8.p1 TRINITY_DN1539_c0_g1~~TRINITY_DN1539_c0_g1_i8.p1  ORF type:complete len:491 (+),score=86.45 TRINITY_DN1539_c0_g1_i8:89-1561(+)
MATSGEQVGAIIQRIKIFVQPRRIRLREFFNDFDQLRCGRCTRAQFARALNTMNFTELSEAEADFLAEWFTEDGPRVEKPQVVNYARFCDLVDEVFVEGNPDPLLSASSPGSTMMSTFRPQSFEDEEHVMHILHRVAVLCQARGIELKYCFTDFANAPVPNPSRPNPRRGGKVTVAQFMRLFPFVKDFGEKEMNILIERYRTKGGDIHFQALHNDVSNVMSTDPPPFPQSQLVLREDPTEWSQQELTPVDKIRSKVVEKRMRLYEQFQDFDPLRKGFCTVGQVKTVFTIMNLAKEINKADFDKLIYTFMRDDGLFNYADFCAEVDSGFTRPGLEKDPLAMIPMPDPSTTEPARRSTIRLGSNRRSMVNELEEKIRTRVKQRRVLIKPMFQDMDRAKRGFITRNQFARVMCSLGFDLSEIDIGLLCGVYTNFGNHLDFNYVDFCKTVDPPDDEVGVAMQQLSSPFQDFTPSRYFNAHGRVQSMGNLVSAMC